MKPKIAVFVSRFGTTVKNLLAAAADGRLDAEIEFVASHKYSTCDEIKGCPWVYVPRESTILFHMARKMDVSLIVLAGWMKLLPVPEDFNRKIVNIHPSLLPKYGGKGMYGIHVHEAVLQAGENLSGCTIHWVDEQYDHGEIIEQTTVPVLEGDTPEVLQERVKAAERQLYPRVINKILSDMQCSRQQAS